MCLPAEESLSIVAVLLKRIGTLAGYTFTGVWQELLSSAP